MSSVVTARRPTTWARVGKTWAPVVPFTAWIVLFLGIPAAAVIIGAFQKPGGGFTMANVKIATEGVYITGFENSFKMALLTAIVPAIAGTLLAYAIHVSRGTFLRRVCVTVSGVFANFGGVPLAFMFIATLGLTGIGTQWLNDLSINLYSHGFTLYSFEGVALVYMYFQIPLMVLVTLPALEGLRHRVARGGGEPRCPLLAVLAPRRDPGADARHPRLDVARFRFRFVRICHGGRTDGRDHRTNPHPDRDLSQRERLGRAGERRQGARARAHPH